MNIFFYQKECNLNELKSLNEKKCVAECGYSLTIEKNKLFFFLR